MTNQRLSSLAASAFILLFTCCRQPNANVSNPPPALTLVPVANPSGLVVVIEEKPSRVIPDFSAPRSLGGGNSIPKKLQEYKRSHRDWKVILSIQIDTKGKAVTAECVSESSEVGKLYAEWAKSWD